MHSLRFVSRLKRRAGKQSIGVTMNGKWGVVVSPRKGDGYIERVRVKYLVKHSILVYYWYLEAYHKTCICNIWSYFKNSIKSPLIRIIWSSSFWMRALVDPKDCLKFLPVLDGPRAVSNRIWCMRIYFQIPKQFWIILGIHENPLPQMFMIKFVQIENIW